MASQSRPKTDVLFVPPIASPVFTEDFEDFIPLGVLALTASLRMAGFRCGIYRPSRALFQQEDYAAVAQDIARHDAQILGFSTWCHSYPSAILLSKEVKSLRPDLIILFGGPQATILDVETIERCPSVDFILRGEADDMIARLVELLLGGHTEGALSQINGLTFRSPSGAGGKIRQNPGAHYIRDLDRLPLAAYDLADLSGDSVTLDVGRGCPFKCTFCTTSGFFARRYRVKSVNRILWEMAVLHRRYGVRAFSFSHDMFTLNKRFVQSLCNSLLQQYEKTNQRFTWTCSARIDCVDQALLSLMARAGCTSIFFGIESGSERVQKLIRKNLRIRDAYGVVDTCKLLKIHTAAAFIAGFPKEEREDLDATLRAVLEVTAKSADAQLSLLSLMPGIPLYEEYKDGLAFDCHFTDFSGSTCGDYERKLIQSDPVLFSSFYHLPVNATERQTLVVINHLANEIRGFKMTVRLIWPALSRHLASGSLLRLIEERALTSENGSENHARDITEELVSALREYVQYLARSSSFIVPPYLFAVFLAEAAMALMKRRFIKNQIVRPRTGRWGRLPDSFGEADLVAAERHWTIIETDYSLRSVVNRLEDGQISVARLRRGAYSYLVTPVSERKVVLYSLGRWQVNMLEQLSSPRPVSELLSHAERFTNRHKAAAVLRKLGRIGVVTFQHSNGATRRTRPTAGQAGTCC